MTISLKRENTKNCNILRIYGVKMEEFAKRIGVVESRARRFIKQAIDAVPAVEEMLDKSFLSEKSKARYKENIRDRAKALSF